MRTICLDVETDGQAVTTARSSRMSRVSSSSRSGVDDDKIEHCGSDLDRTTNRGGSQRSGDDEIEVKLQTYAHGLKPITLTRRAVKTFGG